MAKPRFEWSAGGLNVAAKTLAELSAKEVPPEDTPTGLRDFFEKEGYTIRHKLSRAEIEACSAPNPPWWVGLSSVGMEKMYKRHRAMALAATNILRTERSWPHPLAPAEPEVAIYWWHDEDGCERLSDNSEMGLRTAVDIAGLQPVLYGYRKPLNLPVGVEFKDATDLLPLERFTELRQKNTHVRSLPTWRG